MTDWRKKTNPVYLGLFLFLICGLSAALMAFVRGLTSEPIACAERIQVQTSIQIVLENLEFDNDPFSHPVRLDKDSVLFIAEKDGKTTGYAVQTSGVGYGGVMEGLVSFLPDGSIYRFVITKHSETPGIGTKVTDRVRLRSLRDVVKGIPPSKELPPNAFLDSYAGIRADSPDEMQKQTVHFVTGATISSRGADGIARRAAELLCRYLKGGMSHE